MVSVNSENGTMLSGEVLAKCEEIIAESDEPIATKEMQVAVAVIKEIDVEQTNEEENVVKQVTSHEEMEFKLDEVFNKLQKKVIEDLVAKLKLQERKISLLSKENSLQSCVILQLKKYLQPSPRWFSIVTEVFYFARKYIPGTIMLLNIVTTKSIGRTISKPTKELVMDE